MFAICSEDSFYDGFVWLPNIAVNINHVLTVQKNYGRSNSKDTFQIIFTTINETTVVWRYTQESDRAKDYLKIVKGVM